VVVFIHHIPSISETGRDFDKSLGSQRFAQSSLQERSEMHSCFSDVCIGYWQTSVGSELATRFANGRDVVMKTTTA